MNHLHIFFNVMIKISKELLVQRMEKQNYVLLQAYLTSCLRMDLILIINPRKESSAFGLEDVKRYKRSFPKAKVITRINDSDKTGKSYKADCLRLEACKISDGVVFISNWLLDYYLERGFNKDTPHTVINNGPDENIFNPQGYIPWRKGEVMRIVTHHWSDNCMKGADVYKRFDEILDEPSIRKDFSFTYIGHLPSYPYKIQFKNTKYLVPLALETLASELKRKEVPVWLSLNKDKLESKAIGEPSLDEVKPPAEISLIFEFYSR